LCDTLVVLLCEWDETEEGIMPSPPALNLNGIEATMGNVKSPELW